MLITPVLDSTKTEEERLSTDIVKVGLLKHSIKINIPEKIFEEIERNNKRIEYINEAREKANRIPCENRFPIGLTPVDDVPKFYSDLLDIENRFIGEVLNTTETTHLMDEMLQGIFDRFLNHDPEYMKYI